MQELLFDEHYCWALGNGGVARCAGAASWNLVPYLSIRSGNHQSCAPHLDARGRDFHRHRQHCAVQPGTIAKWLTGQHLGLELEAVREADGPAVELAPHHSETTWAGAQGGALGSQRRLVLKNGEPAVQGSIRRHTHGSTAARSDRT